MTSSENSSTIRPHGKLIAVVAAAAAVIILVVLSALAWPSWAIQRNNGTSTTAQNNQRKTELPEPIKPAIDATALSDDASELLKVMPDSVPNYARTKADAFTTWNSVSLLEEYIPTYSTGDAAKDVTLVATQQLPADNAETQCDASVATQTGDEPASGNVKISGNVTGAHVAKAGASNSKSTAVIRQNDTVVLQATGTKETVDRFYQKSLM